MSSVDAVYLFDVLDKSDSTIILGGAEKGAAKPLGKGDLLYPNGAILERLQALLIENFEIKK